MVISSGGPESAGAGASKVTRDITNTIVQLPDLVEALTGVDLISTIKNLPGMIQAAGSDGQQHGAADLGEDEEDSE